MKKAKMILAMLLVTAFLTSLLPLTAWAEESELIPIVDESEEELILAEKEPVIARAEAKRIISDSYINPLYPELALQAAEAVETAAEPRANAIYIECEGMDGLAALLKQTMLQRSAELYFLMHGESGLEIQMKKLVETACAHSGVPTEGDYLFLHYGTGNLNCSEIPVAGGTDYEGLIRLTYLTTQAQEQTTEATAVALLNSLSVSGMSDVEKAMAIYGHVCENVEMDDSGDSLLNTAYSALVQGRAGSKGYAALIYRLMLSAGLDCRVIFGRANGQDSAWNIIRIDSLYYNADAAMDAGSAGYSWFMKGSQNFVLHTRNREYQLAAFQKAYPTSTEDLNIDELLPAPIIRVQPQNQSVYAGENAEFRVQADGSNLRYQWQFRTGNNGEWKNCSGSAAQTSELVIEAKSYRNGYRYRCQVSNNSGSVTSAAAVLTVKELSMPSISAHPASVTAAAGETAFFAVTAEGGALSYQWQYRTSSGGSWNKCSGNGADTARLSVEVKNYRDGYEYRCQVKNSLGSVYSDVASLGVLPVIIAQPKSVTAAVGDSVSFSVSASGNQLSYQWYFRSGDSAAWSKCSGASAATSSYSVEVKTYRNGYQYRCRVMGSAGSVDSDTAVLSVLAKPIISTQPQSVSAVVGSSVSFSVKASGSGLSYQWQYRTGETGDWNKCSDASAATTNLSVEAKSYRNGYQYRCKVSNTSGSVYSEMATLTVKAGPTITGQPKDAAAAAGETVHFTVTASGSGLNWQWYYRTSQSGEWNKCSGEDAVTNSLAVVAKAYRNGYQYRCKVSNAEGSVYSEAVVLTVS